MNRSQLEAEWLDTNGLGAFAMGTVRGHRSRRYHNLLMLDRDSVRTVLVNGIEVWCQTASETYALSRADYQGGYSFPTGDQFLQSFTTFPHPKWVFQLPDGVRVAQELLMLSGKHTTLLRWTVLSGEPIKLHVRPLLSGRDYHSLLHDQAAFDFRTNRTVTADGRAICVSWQPNGECARIFATVRGSFDEDERWYRQFYYSEEAHRGLDCTEDLACPGEFHFEVSGTPALLAFSTQGPVEEPESEFADEAARRSGRTPLQHASKQYLVKRDQRDTIVAGYPWFTDWGRDTFISLRGLCLASDDLETAKQILLAWSQTISEGMLPNRFPDGDSVAEYNSVDASLWFVVATHEFLSLASRRYDLLTTAEQSQLIDATLEIVSGYQRGTRHQIHADDDGLLAAGEPGVQLPGWMQRLAIGWSLHALASRSKSKRYGSTVFG